MREPLTVTLSPAVAGAMGTEATGYAIALARTRDSSVESAFWGSDGEGSTLGPGSRFPVASITKLATALAILRLSDLGLVGLDDTLAEHLPGAAAAREGVTIRRLLSHTAGLVGNTPGTRPFWPGATWREVRAGALGVSPEWGPGSRVQYSNVGYELLGIVIEAATGQAYAEAMRALVLGPLGIPGSIGGEPATGAVVMTGGASPHFNDLRWRALGLPEAGLVTTIEGALALGRAFLGVGNLITPETAAEAIRDQAVGLPGGGMPPQTWDQCPWGLGVEIRGTKWPHFGPRTASPSSFGHAGLAGGIVWVEPETGEAFAILGSRTAEIDWLETGGPLVPLGEAILAEMRS